MPLSFYQTLLEYSFRLLAGKSYTEAEISKKLLRRAKKLKFPESEEKDAISKVLSRLKELRYLDDQRIVENYFDYRLKTRPTGKFLFLHEMHRRGIPFQQASIAWDKHDIDESKLAAGLLHRKSRAWVGMPRILKKKKTAQFLASRGFSPETVWGLVEKM